MILPSEIRRQEIKRPPGLRKKGNWPIRENSKFTLDKDKGLEC